MKIPLSPRLAACCQFVSPGDRVADIGTDHGYLGIWLLHKDIAKSVIAADIAPGPLSAARQNAAKYDCLNSMEFYLSDGVSAVPKDFDTMVCAGMGGDTMISILSAAPWLMHEKYKLILQCQSKTHLLRRFLSENGWHINQEVLLRDGKFLYTVMEVLFRSEPALTPGEWYLSPALLKSSAPELVEYYQRIIGGLRLYVSGHGDSVPQEQLAALQQLESDPKLQWLKENIHDNSERYS